tara:strand:+ start:3914 stop:4225 length:312 start_codon:yes stop_codon:yes gene_type:complete
MGQKLHEQNAQEISNNQILKLANENKLLESKLVLSDAMKKDADIKLKQAIDRLDSASNRANYEQLKAYTHEQRADFNGKVAGCLLATNIALCSSILIYLGVTL